MLRWLSCKFQLVIIAVFCLSVLIIPDVGFAQGKSQSRDVLISFRQIPGPNERALVRAVGGVIKYSYRLVPGIAASVPQAAVDGLSHNPNVVMIEDDLAIYAVDAELDRCWGVERIGAGTVHTGGNRGAGVKVAIIDSGIDYTHPDLDAHFDDSNRGYDFVNGDDDPMDDHGHGTHCAGIVAAEDNGTGAVGVAPEAELYGLKVLGANGSGSYSNVIAALNWCVFGPDGDPDTGDEPGIQVTSNSYGSPGNPGSMVELAFNRAEAAGIINVCAAGNSGNSAGTGDNMIYPARFASCIAVAATTISDVRASFSSTGQQMELAAPGAGIYSTLPGNAYASWSGTSMACPHVSGVVALMIKAGVADIRAKLIATADNLGAPGWDPQYGYGLVNAVKAVGESSGSTNNPPTVSIYHPGYGQTLNDTYRVLVSASDDGGTIYLIELSVDGAAYFDITANFDGTYYYYDWDTTSLSDGNHTLQARATDYKPQSTESSIVEVTVDNVDEQPTAAIVNPGDGSTVSGTAIIQVDATDIEDTQGTLTVEVSIDGGSGQTASYNSISGYYELDWDTDGQDGSHTIDASATDSGTNTTDAIQVTVTVDNSAPSISLYVYSINVTSVKVDKGLKGGLAVVTIFDNYGPVQGATVIGSFKDDIKEESVEALYDTDLNGMTEFFTNGTIKGRCHLTFCVDIVSYNNVDYSGNDIQICGSNY